jgi:4-aminobutyrate aminotransferase
LRIAPPLLITEEELERGMSTIEEAIDDVEKGKVPDDVVRRMGGW